MAEEVGRREEVELVLEFHRQVVQFGLFVVELECFFHKTFETRFFIAAKSFVSELFFIGQGKMKSIKFLFVLFDFDLFPYVYLTSGCRLRVFSGKQIGIWFFACGFRVCFLFWWFEF